MALSTVRLLPQRHKRVQGGNPWIFSNEIQMDSAAKSITAGSLVTFAAHDKSIIGIGSFNPHNLIAGRIYTRSAVAEIDEAWLETRITAAIHLRDALIPTPFYRLVHAEADGLPGLIIDRFGKHLSVQVNTAGMELLWPMLEAVLKRTLNPASITLKNDSAARRLEGLPLTSSTVFGEVPDVVEVEENGLTYLANIAGGQKTGWYFDQRDNHALVARFAKDRTLLDLYSHAGGFGLLASKHGATKVVCVDASAPCLALAEQAVKQNKLKNVEFKTADVFEDMERRIAAKETWDIVVADPPAFVKSKKDIASGGRGYRKLARLSAKVTAKGGLLFIASCSHNMGLGEFTAHVAAGLHDAGRDGKILYTSFAGPDHPVHPHLPESAYLKGLFIQL